ncbi:tRNA epoxyqueuosine(34) reductase QueG [Prochlorococcus sp. MIT 1307]|uniref:tRNA epoxyqueuosine(34) reductase QueG n=1 Tax=Prochlorococcus sp. MIT 1307 TaxID=3096219 RepID=UPI002A75EA7B|nr:tRNA epoxyqueuosine(34) reductase QueG [Prochlorococcus sp. MIT 1307]
MKTPSELSKALKKEAKSQGFTLVGIATIPGSDRIALRTAALQRWLNAGHQGEMKWMAAPRRQKIETLLEDAKSLLSVGLNYYVKENKEAQALSIARYGWGKDYHKVIKQRLKRIGRWLEKERPNTAWKICVDSAPLLEKAWAEEAGLGWIGKNSNLINQHHGSWMVLGHLLSTEPLLPDTPTKPLCGKCQICIDACPTKAISEPFVINSNLCLAYHTIENRSAALPKTITASLGNWIAGCDICQEVCPWNQKELQSSKDPAMQPKDWMLKLTKEQALSWSDNKWNEKLNGSALKRIKPWMWRRNAEAIQSDI